MTEASKSLKNNYLRVCTVQKDEIHYITDNNKKFRSVQTTVHEVTDDSIDRM